MSGVQLDHWRSGDMDLDLKRANALIALLHEEYPDIATWLSIQPAETIVQIIDTLPDCMNRLKRTVMADGDALGDWMTRHRSDDPVARVPLKDVHKRLQAEGIIGPHYNTRRLAITLRSRGYIVKQQSGKTQVFGVSLPTAGSEALREV